jgi:hypothetical protein
MTEEINEAPSTEPIAEQTAPQAAPDLNISDLLAVKNIIEVATSRGAFKAAELEAVGKTFNKLNNFLESVSKKEA